jgi:hypothetical protein
MKFLSIASIFGVVTNAQSLSMMSAPNLMSMDGTEYDTFQVSDSKGSNRKYHMMDYFLFAGQSNSIGHTTSDQSIGYDETYWLNLMRLFSIAEFNGTTSMWKQNLYDTIHKIHDYSYPTYFPTNIPTYLPSTSIPDLTTASNDPTIIPWTKRPSQKPTTKPTIAMPSEGTTLIPVTESRMSDLPTSTGTPTRVITYLRDEVVKLQELGLLDQMNQSLPLGHCSYVDFDETSAPIDMSSGSKSTKWNANCGMSFGYELIFSKTLEINGVRRSFETVKVARGGSRLYEGWYPDSGLQWMSLQNSIRNRSGAGKNWMGFVWSQGEMGK